MNDAERKELITLLRKAADYLEAEENRGERIVPFNTEEIVLRYMCTLGISAKSNGFRNLKKAVIMCIDNEEMINGAPIKDLCSKVAEFYNTTTAAVYHSIRHAIEQMWTKGNRELQYKIFGYSSEEKTVSPSPKEFLYKFAGYIIITHMV